MEMKIYQRFLLHSHFNAHTLAFLEPSVSITTQCQGTATNFTLILTWMNYWESSKCKIFQRTWGWVLDSVQPQIMSETDHLWGLVSDIPTSVQGWPKAKPVLLGTATYWTIRLQKSGCSSGKSRDNILICPSIVDRREIEAPHEDSVPAQQGIRYLSIISNFFTQRSFYKNCQRYLTVPLCSILGAWDVTRLFCWNWPVKALPGISIPDQTKVRYEVNPFQQPYGLFTMLSFPVKKKTS